MSDPLEFLPHNFIVDNPRVPRPIAIEGVLRVGDLCIITGGFDVFKSSLALELAWSLATGYAWLGRPDFQVQRRIRVGILQAEIDPGSYDERCQRYPRTPDLLVSSCIGFTFDRMEELREVAEDAELEGLVLDPLGMMWPRAASNGEPFSENHKNHVSPLLTELKEFGMTVVLCHHDPKANKDYQGRASGSSAILNDPDVRIFVDRVAGTNDINITIRNRLQKAADPLTARFDTDTMRLEVIQTGRPRSRRDRPRYRTRGALRD